MSATMNAVDIKNWSWRSILTGIHYYDYGENKTEQAAKRYWDEIKGGS